MKLNKIFLLSLSFLILTGCKQIKPRDEIYEDKPFTKITETKQNLKETKEISKSENYSIQTHEGETFYIIEKDYDKENFSIQEIFSDNYNDNTYPELKDKGEILTYQEYIAYCSLLDIVPEFSDENKNYLVLSYGSSHSWVNVRLCDIEYDEENKNITMYVWDDSNGVMGSGSGYVLTIPTNYTKEYSIDIKTCMTQEWFDTITDEIKYEEYIYNMTLDKPVIYLYPEQITKLDISLDLKGELKHTYPKYKDKWTVTAMPNGTLFDENGRMYNYLFWEGETNTKFDLTEGFCIKGENTLEFLEDSLTKLGLNYKEQCDFISYWLPLMEENPYNVISFQKENYTNIAKINTSEKIDTEIRVFMCYKPSNTYVNIKEQILTAPERKGFVLIEWGGTELK